MPPSATERFVRRRTSWLLLFLCTALLAMRIDFRIEQCHQITANAPAAVPFFDANEKNIASLDQAQAHQPCLLEAAYLFMSFPLPASPLKHAERWQPQASTALPDIPPGPISLFANPPPIA